MILKRSTSRTLDPQKADVLVPAIPFSRLTNAFFKADMVPALEYLIHNPLFKENAGHRHVLIGTSFCLFKKDCNFVMVMLPYMHHFVNTTLAISWDPNAVSTAIKEGYYGDFNEYKDLFKEYATPFPLSSISVGLNPQPGSSVVSFPEYTLMVSSPKLLRSQSRCELHPNPSGLMLQT